MGMLWQPVKKECSAVSLQIFDDYCRVTVLISQAPELIDDLAFECGQFPVSLLMAIQRQRKSKLSCLETESG